MSGFVRLAMASVIAVAAAQPAKAADWLQSLQQQAPAPIAADPIELGTGWYLRGDVANGSDTLAPLLGNSTATRQLSTWSADIGVGYQMNNWLRFDASLNMRKPQNNTASTLKLADGVTNIVCPYQLQGLTSQGAGTQLGYLWSDQAGTCSQNTTASLRTMALMLNGYIDLGTWSGLTPYVGAGAGVARLASETTVNFYKTSDGSLYAANLSPTGTFPLIWIDQFGNVVGGSLANQPTVPGSNPAKPVTFAQQNWSQKLSATRYNFAWALMAGVAYNITDRAKIDIGFRYLNQGGYQVTAGSKLSPVTSKEVKVGFRYMID